MTPPRRATRLEVPPPGPRCPSCWTPANPPPPPGTVVVCGVCYVLVLCPSPGTLLVLDPQRHWQMLPGAELASACRQRNELILTAAARWRLLPRPPPQAGFVRIWR